MGHKYPRLVASEAKLVASEAKLVDPLLFEYCAEVVIFLEDITTIEESVRLRNVVASQRQLLDPFLCAPK